MVKKVYIDGNLLVKKGMFFGLNFCMYADEKFKEEADEIIPCNENGIYEVAEDGGSMFTEYYVRGGITMYGENGSNIFFFKNEHERTYEKFKHIQEQILLLLEKAIIPEEYKNYFYHQQFILLYANLEYFLYNTFMWETCQCYDSYKRMLPVLARYSRTKEIVQILKGEHCILQERSFVEQVKYIVYHSASKVNEIYDAAFKIKVDLNEFKNELDIRHDIVHRAGYTKEGQLVRITKEQIFALKDKVEELVEKIVREISIFNKSKG